MCLDVFTLLTYTACVFKHGLVKKIVELCANVCYFQILKGNRLQTPSMFILNEVKKFLVSRIRVLCNLHRNWSLQFKLIIETIAHNFIKPLNE